MWITQNCLMGTVRSLVKSERAGFGPEMGLTNVGLATADHGTLVAAATKA